MKKNKFLKTLLASLMAVSVISTSAVPANAEEAETETEVEIFEEPEEEVLEVEEEPVDEGELEVEVEPEPEEELTGTGSLEFESSADEVTVTAAAPEGAFPEGTEMAAETVTDTEVLDLIKNAVGENAEVLAAVDITFTSEGEAVQPDEAVKVAFAASGITYSENLKVVHVDDKGEELTATVLEQELIETEDGGVAFDADSFSIYAVVNEGSTAEEARATIKFWRSASDAEPVATVYVKNGDTLEELEDIVYDPGIGDLEVGQVFKGWTTDQNYTSTTVAKTVGKIREELAARSAEGSENRIVEGEVIDYYAMVFKPFDIVYYGDVSDVALGSDIVLVPANVENPTATYTVNRAYTPKDNVHNFEGWLVLDGKSNIQGYVDGAAYENGTEITISGDINFGVNAPEGHWLVFDENGKGGKYNAPRFIKSGEVTERPVPDSEMTRFGYTFGGWYKDAECTDGNEFTFGGELDDYTTIYAKWISNTQAGYTVIIWKRNVKNDGYDFYKSVAIANATVGSTPNAVTVNGSGTGAYATVNGTAYTSTSSNTDIRDAFTGFHFSSTDQADKTVITEGSTVVNVYYDRNEVTFTFYTYQGSGYVYTLITGSPSTSGTTTYYALIGGQYRELTYYPNASWGGSPAGWYYGGSWTSRGTQYTGSDFYTREYNSGGWNVYKTMKGLYGSTLESNNYEWPEEYDWYANGGNNGSVSGIRTTFLDAFLPSSGGTSENFYGRSPQGNGHIYFYKQNATKTGYEQANEVVTNANGFNLTDKYNGFKCVAWNTTESTSNWNVVGEKMQQDGNWYYDADPSQSGYQSASFQNNLYVYFDRLEYTLSYLNGSYYNTQGDHPLLEETASPTSLKEISDITYGADISKYNSGTDYFTPPAQPAHDGYEFAGWYLDDACTQPATFTTMPEGGLTVFAGWFKIQYRVFLHVNYPTQASSDINWGTTNQQMTFRVSYGEKVSAPTGVLAGYDFIGWHTDEACKNAFSSSAYVLNETTVTTPYDKTKDWTDKYDINGILQSNPAPYNSDITGYDGKDRFWITKRFDIYASWSANIPGAEGIGIEYYSEGSKFATDKYLYIDSANVISHSASTSSDSNKVFRSWIVQKWNGTDYEDTNVSIYPGEDFTVKVADAKREPRLDDEGNPMTDDEGKPLYTYTVRVRADYGDKEVPKDTHINWFANNGTDAKVSDTGLQINQSVAIRPADTFSYNGHVFIGWARVVETATLNEDGETYTYTYATPTDSDMFLWYNRDTELFYTDAAYTQEVKKIAADEKDPYHAMVAVWGDAYTIMFSSDLSTKSFLLEDDVDLLELLEEHNAEHASKGEQTYLYGGYYHYDTVVEGLEPYTASQEQLDIVAANGKKGYWQRFTPYTTSWSALEKENGKTYFVKEVPDYYFAPYLQYYYKTRYANFLTQMYAVTGIDDARYQKVGFARLTNTTEEYNGETLTYSANGATITALPTPANKVKYSSTLTFTPSTGDPVNLNAKAVVASRNGLANAGGYVVSADITEGLAHENNGEVWYDVDNSFSHTTFNYIPYYVTHDGVTVIGKYLRRVKTDLGYQADLELIGEDLGDLTVDDMKIN